MRQGFYVCLLPYAARLQIDLADYPDIGKIRGQLVVGTYRSTACFVAAEDFQPLQNREKPLISYIRIINYTLDLLPAVVVDTAVSFMQQVTS